MGGTCDASCPQSCSRTTRISGCSTSALGDGGGGGDAGGMSAHTTLFERVRASYKEEDLLVSAAVAHKQQCSVADLGADTRLMGCDLSEAVGKMRSLSLLLAPLYPGQGDGPTAGDAGHKPGGGARHRGRRHPGHGHGGL